MNIYIAIISAHCYADRRAAVRDTWFKRLLPGMSARFILGEGPNVDEPDICRVPSPDDWDGLWHKMRETIRYSLRPDQPKYDYLFRCDDDTYLVPERLESAATSGDYIGRLWDHNPVYCMGGAGYLLSRALAEKLAGAADCPDLPWGDDGWVGFHARENGVMPVSCERFTASPQSWPTPKNDFITGHSARSPKLLRDYHSRYTGEITA